MAKPAYGPCQDSAFHFTDGASASAAARALAEQVFPVSTEWFPSTFPGTTRGCGSTRDCWIFTPFSTSGDQVAVAAFHNAFHMPDTLTFLVEGIDAEYSNVGFARWSEAASIVPEPRSIALLSIALAGIGLVRRIR